MSMASYYLADLYLRMALFFTFPEYASCLVCDLRIWLFSLFSESSLWSEAGLLQIAPSYGPYLERARALNLAKIE